MKVGPFKISASVNLIRTTLYLFYLTDEVIRTKKLRIFRFRMSYLGSFSGSTS